MRRRNLPANVVYVIVSLAALTIYIDAPPAFLGTFVGYWLAVPAVLATVGLFLLAGKWWLQLLWLNLPIVLAAIRWLYVSRNEPDAMAFIVFDAGYWVVAGSIMFLTLKLVERSIGKAA